MIISCYFTSSFNFLFFIIFSNKNNIDGHIDLNRLSNVSYFNRKIKILKLKNTNIIKLGWTYSSFNTSFIFIKNIFNFSLSKNFSLCLFKLPTIYNKTYSLKRFYT